MTDRRDRIAAAALAHVDCCAHLNLDRYNEIIVRPADNSPSTLRYYDDNPQLSTCALFAIGCLRLAGCQEAECTARYLPAHGPMRNAVADVQALARRFGAWVTSSAPTPPLRRGDVWIIVDDKGGRMFVCSDTDYCTRRRQACGADSA